MADFNEPQQTVFMRNVFTFTSSFRHTVEIERAFQKACEEKHCTKAHVIYCCLTGEENLNRYLNSFDADDLRWCYEEKLRILAERDRVHPALDQGLDSSKGEDRSSKKPKRSANKG